VHNALNINEGATLVVRQRRGKLRALLGVYANDVLKKLDIVGLVASLGSVWQDLIELTRLGIASDDFVGHVRLEVDAESHVDVMRPHHITQLLGAVKLVLLEPLLQEVLAALCED